MERVYVATNSILAEWDVEANEWRSDIEAPADRIECLAVHPDRPSVLFVGSFESGLYRRTDSRVEQVAKEALDGRAITSVSVAPSDPDVVVAGTEPSGLVRSKDGGDTWERAGGLTDVPSANTWSFPPRPDTHHVRWVGIHPRDPDRWYVGIEAGALLVTTDGGESWIDRPPGSRRDTHCIATHAADPDRVYTAAGDGYAESDDGGLEWRESMSGLAHRYVWSVAVDPEDPEVRIVSAATGARSAHRSDTADSYVYRRVGAANWQRVETAGLPTEAGVLRPVVAAGTEAGAFVAASNRGLSIRQDGTWQHVADEIDGADRTAAVRAIAAI